MPDLNLQASGRSVVVSGPPDLNITFSATTTTNPRMRFGASFRTGGSWKKIITFHWLITTLFLNMLLALGKNVAVEI